MSQERHFPGKICIVPPEGTSEFDQIYTVPNSVSARTMGDSAYRDRRHRGGAGEAQGIGYVVERWCRAVVVACGVAQGAQAAARYWTMVVFQRRAPEI
ncbi:hypothetical protein U1Q18_008594 [Sarracenia purpurea var. burkii]